MEKPWLAAINGPAVGGGASLSMACDLALAAESAYLCVTYVNIGMVTDMGSTYMLPRLVGQRKAAELALFGDRIPAAEAERIGLINRAVPDNELMDTAHQWAARLARGPSVAIGAIKLGLRRALHGTYRDTLHWEAMMISLIAQTEDAAEGVMAFVEKREARYKGR
jgi:2-(1,2-epoxy-1,2-dihydrophenyl)acetyl-CoA isomerase